MNNIEKYLKKHNVEVEHILSSRCEKQHNLIIRLDGGEDVRCYMLMQELMEVIPEDELMSLYSCFLRVSSNDNVSTSYCLTTALFCILLVRTIVGKTPKFSTKKDFLPSISSIKESLFVYLFYSAFSK